MTRRFENLQPSLFDENEPGVELATPQRVELAMLVEALLREIATALTNGESADDEDHV